MTSQQTTLVMSPSTPQSSPSGGSDKNQMDVKLKMLHCTILKDNVNPPKRMTDGAAGYDVFLPETVEVLAHQTTRIKLGFTLDIPSSNYALMRDRSNIVTGRGLLVVAGVIDSGNFSLLFRELTSSSSCVYTFRL